MPHLFLLLTILLLPVSSSLAQAVPTRGPSLPGVPSIPQGSPSLPKGGPSLPGVPGLPMEAPSLSSSRDLIPDDVRRPSPTSSTARYPRLATSATQRAFRRVHWALRDLGVPYEDLGDLSAFVDGAPRSLEEAFDPLGDIRAALGKLRSEGVSTRRATSMVGALQLGMRKLIRLEQGGGSAPTMEERKAALRARIVPFARALAGELEERSRQSF